MITDRDREIINFIYDFGFITIEQAGKLFFTDSNVAYDLARRRLKKISENSNYIKSRLNSETRQLLYVPKESNIKGASKHSILILDYLAELKALGVTVENVYVEKDYGGIVPDMIVIFRFGGYRMYQLVEVQLRHDVVDINRYERVISEILKDTNNVLPTIIIIQNTNKDYRKDNKTDMDIVQLRTDLSDVAKVLL